MGYFYVVTDKDEDEDKDEEVGDGMNAREVQLLRFARALTKALKHRESVQKLKGMRKNFARALG